MRTPAIAPLDVGIDAVDHPTVRCRASRHVHDRADPVAGSGQVVLGHPLVDDYLEVVRARWRRNTLWATAYDLKVFFTVVGKDPVEVTVADVLGFIRTQRGAGSGKVVRLADRDGGLALSTVRRRLSSVSGFYGYLMAVGVVEINPVLRGIAARTASGRVRRRAPLVRLVRLTIDAVYAELRSTPITANGRAG